MKFDFLVAPTYATYIEKEIPTDSTYLCLLFYIPDNCLQTIKAASMLNFV